MLRNRSLAHKRNGSQIIFLTDIKYHGKVSDYVNFTNFVFYIINIGKISQYYYLSCNPCVFSIKVNAHALQGGKNKVKTIEGRQKK